MELGVKNWQDKARAVSSALNKPPMFRFQASAGLDSALATTEPQMYDRICPKLFSRFVECLVIGYVQCFERSR